MTPPEGLAAEAEALDFAAEVAGLVLTTLGLRSFEPPERALLVEALARRTGLAPERIAALPELSTVARAAKAPSAAELQVFVEYFGRRVGPTPGPDAPQPSLADFAGRHGDDATLLLCGLLIGASRVDDHTSGAEFGRLLIAARELGIDGTLFLAIHQRAPGAPGPHETRLALGTRPIIVGRDSACDVVLPHPSVGPVHAELVPAGAGWRVVSRHPRPTTVQGAGAASAPVAPGTVIGIGAYDLRLDGRHLVVAPPRPISILTVRGLCRRHGDRDLLADVSFTAFTGELIALVGPSGSGKSTLLDAISGVFPAESGQVLLDGQPLHELVQRDPSLVGQVPQDDLVLPELTVEECLRFAGRFRAGERAPAEEIDARVERVLGELGLDRIRHSRVGDALRRGISGGQRKRVNLGQELMSPSTRVLFLDEPTSGLDPRAAADIVRLARRLADQGRIVFLVTHDLGAGMLAQVDQLMLLAPGGRLVWYGPPAEACESFGVSVPGEIFDRLGDSTPEQWHARFRQTAAARTYVRLRQSFPPLPTPRETAGTVTHRTALTAVVQRSLLVKARDRAGLLVMLLQPLLLAGVMAMVFRHATTPLLFMLTLSCLWLGMSGAVRELLSDRGLWLRERRVGAGVGAYLGGKSVVVAAITAAQCGALTAIVFASCGLASGQFSLGHLTMVAVLTGWAGMTLGLLVSAMVSSTEAAIGLLVLLLIPQIAFSGIVMPLSEVSAPARALSLVTVQRYALDAALRAGETVEYRNRTDWQRRPTAGDLFLYGLRPAGEPPTGHSSPRLALILSGLALLHLGAAAVFVARRRG